MPQSAESGASGASAPKPAKPPIYLLDAMSFIFRAYHAMQWQRPMSTRSERGEMRKTLQCYQPVVKVGICEDPYLRG
jgi:5'-3' exonuclease